MFDVYVLIFHVWWLFLDITTAVEEAQEKHEQRKKRGRVSEIGGTYRKRTRSVPTNVYECARIDGQGY